MPNIVFAMNHAVQWREYGNTYFSRFSGDIGFMSFYLFIYFSS